MVSPPHLESPCSPSDALDLQTYASSTQEMSQLKNTLTLNFSCWKCNFSDEAVLKCFCQNHISGKNPINLPNTLNETYPKTTWTQHRKQFLDGQRGMQSECSSKSKYSFQFFENWKPCVTWYKGQVLQFVHWGHMVMLKLDVRVHKMIILE